MKTLARLGLAAALVTTTALPAFAQSDEPFRIGWTAWSDAEFVTKLAERIITDELGHEVELIQTDIAPQYLGLQEGDIDAMLMAWLPTTHADYWAEVQDDVVQLGVLYTDAKLGWVVPSYVPEDEVASIADLADPDVRERFGGTIQGIDPGAGLMRLSEQTIEAYGLDYDLITASGAAMTAALDEAIRRNEWIVVTGWSPHWMFGAYDLRYLDDPMGTLGGAESIYALGRQGVQEDFPEISAFLMRLNLPLDELEAAMFDAQQTSYEEAVDHYIEQHPDRIRYWVTGESEG